MMGEVTAAGGGALSRRVGGRGLRRLAASLGHCARGVWSRKGAGRCNGTSRQVTIESDLHHLGRRVIPHCTDELLDALIDDDCILAVLVARRQVAKGRARLAWWRCSDASMSAAV